MKFRVNWPICSGEVVGNIFKMVKVAASFDFQLELLSRDRTSVGHDDDGLDAITSNQRINATFCKNKNKHVFKKLKKTKKKKQL